MIIKLDMEFHFSSLFLPYNSRDKLVVTGGGNQSTRQKPWPNPKSLATFSHDDDDDDEDEDEDDDDEDDDDVDDDDDDDDDGDDDDNDDGDDDDDNDDDDDDDDDILMLLFHCRQSPSGNEFIENTKHKVWLKIPLDDLEIMHGKL